MSDYKVLHALEVVVHSHVHVLILTLQSLNLCLQCFNSVTVQHNKTVLTHTTYIRIHIIAQNVFVYRCIGE